MGSDYYAIERASDQWRAATRAISYHQAQGHTIPIPAETLAKLCALKVISPMLFDAACLDPAMLLQLERQAQARGTASLGLNGWSEVLARDPRLMRLFASEPRLAGTHASYLLAALRLIQTGDAEALQALQHQPAPARRCGQARRHYIGLSRRSLRFMLWLLPGCSASPAIKSPGWLPSPQG